MAAMKEWSVVETIVYRVRARTGEQACNVIIEAEQPDEYYWMCSERYAEPWPEEIKTQRSFVR